MLIRKDGTELNIADSGAPIRNQKGEITGIVLVFRDITMERKTQEALIPMRNLPSRDVWQRRSHTRFIIRSIPSPTCSTSCATAHHRRSQASLWIWPSRSWPASPDQPRDAWSLPRIKAPVAVDLREMLQEILLLLERRLSRLGVTITTDMPNVYIGRGVPCRVAAGLHQPHYQRGRGREPGRQNHSEHHATDRRSRRDGQQRCRPGALVTITDNGTGIAEEIRTHLFQPSLRRRENAEPAWDSGSAAASSISTAARSRSKATPAKSRMAPSLSVFLATNPTISAGGD